MASARGVWASLQGILCVYKPAELSITSLKKSVIRRLAADCKEVLAVRRPAEILLPQVEEAESGALLVVDHKKQIDYSEHPLVCGAVLRAEDLRVEESQYVEPTTSGLCLLGLNDGCDELSSLAALGPNEYRLEGILGRQTRDNMVKSRVTLKAPYEHVTKHKMLKLLTKVQSHFRRVSYEVSGLDPQGDEAFEIARRGVFTPIPGAFHIYRIWLRSFRPPYFSVGVVCCGESDLMLRNLVNEIGISLGCTASPVRVVRSAAGPFRPDDALLEKQINLQNVIRNIAASRRLIAAKKKAHVNEMEVEEEQARRQVVDAVGARVLEEEEDAMRPAWPRDYQQAN